MVTCNEFQREVAVSQNIAGKHIDRIFTFDKVMFRLIDYYNVFVELVKYMDYN